MASPRRLCASPDAMPKPRTHDYYTGDEVRMRRGGVQATLAAAGARSLALDGQPCPSIERRRPCVCVCVSGTWSPGGGARLVRPLLS